MEYRFFVHTIGTLPTQPGVTNIIPATLTLPDDERVVSMVVAGQTLILLTEKEKKGGTKGAS